MKNSKLLLGSIALTASMILSGCYYTSLANVNVNNGKESDATVKKEIKIGDFNKVDVSQGIKVIFQQGANSGTASIATTPSAEKYLSISVKNNILEVHYANSGKFVNNVKGPSIVRVSSPSLSNVDLSSAAMFVLEGEYKGSEIVDIDMSSGSSFNAQQIDCPKLKIDISSGASAFISRFDGNLKVEASSGSNVKIENAIGDLLSLESSSGAGVHINGIVSEEIYADASSGSSISLEGKTGKLKKESSSGASIKTGGLKINQ